jgi:hypothetical protein
MSAQPAGTSAENEPLVRLPSDDGILEFAGKSIGKVSTEQPGKLRWVEIAIHKVMDGTGRYVLSRVGRSVVYHRDDGPCHRGSRVLAVTVSKELKPCPMCQPSPVNVIQMTPGSTIFVEADYHGAAICASAADLVSRLRLPDPLSSSGTAAPGSIRGAFSEPAQRLLIEARANDNEVNAALSVIKRV